MKDNHAGTDKSRRVRCRGDSIASVVRLVTPGCNDGRHAPRCAPPLKPMLAKAATAVPEQPDDGDPVWSTNRNGTGSARSSSATATRWCSARAAERIWRGTFPRWSRPFGRNCRERLRARRGTGGAARRSTVGRGWTGRRCRSGSTPPRAGCALLAEQTPAQLVGFDLLALGDDDLTAEAFSVRVASSLLDFVGGGPSLPRHRRDHRHRATAQAWFDDVRGRGPRRGGREEAGGPLPAEQAGDGEGQARPHRGLSS